MKKQKYIDKDIKKAFFFRTILAISNKLYTKHPRVIWIHSNEGTFNSQIDLIFIRLIDGVTVISIG